MDSTTLIEIITHATGLNECGENIIRFTDACLKEINSEELIGNLYYEILTLDEKNIVANTSTLSEKYVIYEGNAAVLRYLRGTLPDFCLPVNKMLKKINHYGKKMCKTFFKNKYQRLTIPELQAILNYVETEFSFVSKILVRDKVAQFLFYDCSTNDFTAGVSQEIDKPDDDYSFVFFIV